MLTPTNRYLANLNIAQESTKNHFYANVLIYRWTAKFGIVNNFVRSVRVAVKVPS